MIILKIGHPVEAVTVRESRYEWERAVIVSDACGAIRVRLMRTGIVRKVALHEMREVA